MTPSWGSCGGGSQTPWTSDIDADNFSLLDLGSNITARAALSVASANNVAGASGAVTAISGTGTTGTGALNLLTGNATLGTAGDIVLNVGTSFTSNGSILVGTAARTQTITIGNSTGGTITVGASSGSDLVLNDAQWSIDGTGSVTGLSGTLTGITAGDLSCTNCIGPTEITDLTLTTDTAGNYVASVGTSILTGLSGGAAGSEGSTLTLALDYSQVLSGDVGLGANAAVFGVSGLVFEGSAADTVETFISITDPTTSDKTITIPDASGTVILSGHTFTSDVTATLGSGGTTALTIAGDSVALTTDTTGNYVTSANTSVLTGLTGGSSGSEGAALTLAFDYSQALSGDVGLAANTAVFGQNGLVFEGSTANTFETFFSVTNPTADRTMTFPDRSGTVALSGDTFTTDVTGTLDVSGITALTIAANSVALTTDTTGNYVAGVTASGGLTLTGTEGGTLGITLPTATDALSSTTSSGSGMELVSAGLGLLQGCADGQILKWTEASDTWSCQADSTGAGGGISNIDENNASVLGSAISIDFLGSDFNVSVDSTEGDIAIDYTNSGITRKAQAETVTGGWTFNTAATTFTTAINANGGIVLGTNNIDGTNFDVIGSNGNVDIGGTITAGSGNEVITLATGKIDADALTLTVAADGGTGTSSGSGLAVRSDGIGLLQGCTDGQVLKWVESTDTWDCAADSTGAGGGDTTKFLSANQTSSSTTMAKVTGLDTTIAAGTWAFRYIVVYQSTATATAVKLGVNFSGTQTKFVAEATGGEGTTAASTGVVDQVHTAFGLRSGGASRSPSTTVSIFGPTAVDTVNADMMAIINGIVVVTVSGDIQLYFGSEATGSTQTIMANSSLILTPITAGADLAEIYSTTDTTIEPGDVVSLDSSLNAGVKKSSKAYDANVFGIIATSPGLVIGTLEDEGTTPVEVALTGRVPVKVTTENGPIKFGDLLTSSSIPGVAMRATKAGQIVGQAMSEFGGDGVGKVIAFIKTDYGNGAKLDISIGKAALLAQFVSQKAQLEDSADLSEVSTDRLVAGLEVITPKLFADEIIITGSSVFLGNVEFTFVPQFNKDTGGFAVISQGGSEVEVNFEKEYGFTPVVVVTPDQPVLYSVVNNNTKGFTIKINSDSGTDVKFNWIALAIKDARTVLGKSATGTPEPTATPIPSVSPSATPVATGTPEPTESPTPTPSPTETPISTPSL